VVEVEEGVGRGLVEGGRGREVGRQMEVGVEGVEAEAGRMELKARAG
jgi:hypothetical protein